MVVPRGEFMARDYGATALLMPPVVQNMAVCAMPADRLGDEVGSPVFAPDTVDIAALREFWGALDRTWCALELRIACNLRLIHYWVFAPTRLSSGRFEIGRLPRSTTG